MFKNLISDFSLLSARVWRRISIWKEKEVLVFAPTNTGSLGDQAMLEAVRSHISDELKLPLRIIYFSNWGEISTKKSQIKLMLPQYTGKKFTITSALAFSSARFVAALGADIIDGTYNENSILVRLNFLKLARKSGLSTCILGSSISTLPSSKVMKTIGDETSLRFMARDSISLTRFESAAGRPGELAADLAFLLKPSLSARTAIDAAAWMKNQRAANGKILILNVGGHALSSVEQGIPKLCEIFSQWLDADQDRCILCVPHDFRKSAMDLDLTMEFVDSLGRRYDERIYWLQPPYNAWDVKALCENADYMLTCRMHCAIAGLGGGLAPLCLIYQGKFEGMLKHFTLEGDDLAHPATALNDQDNFYRILENYCQRSEVLRERIATRLPEVEKLSLQNFNGIK